MKRSRLIKKSNTVPLDSVILNGFKTKHYCDSFSCTNNEELSNDEIINRIMTLPGWVNVLFEIRTAMVKPFGLQTEFDEFKPCDCFKVGHRVGFFEVVARTNNELVLEGFDKHLKARLSVFQETKAYETRVHLTTVVYFNNAGGRLYFIPVKPFHKLIVKSMLKKVRIKA